MIITIDGTPQELIFLLRELLNSAPQTSSYGTIDNRILDLVNVGLKDAKDACDKSS